MSDSEKLYTIVKLENELLLTNCKHLRESLTKKIEEIEKTISVDLLF